MSTTVSGWTDEVRVLMPRDRIQLELNVERDTYAPGDTVDGVLNVIVRRDVEITAIRIRLVGKEKCDVGGEKKAVDREFFHLERLITVFGYSKASKRRTGAQLAEGTYAYPFSLNIPIKAPPSYAMQLPRKSSFHARLTYKLSAIAVIPYTVDRVVQRELTVLSIIPQQQYQDTVEKVKTLNKTELEVIQSSGCCASKKREFIGVNGTMHPYFLLIPTDSTAIRQGDTSSANAATKTDMGESVPIDRDPSSSPATTGSPYYSADQRQGNVANGDAQYTENTNNNNYPNAPAPDQGQNYSRYDSARKDHGNGGNNNNHKASAPLPEESMQSYTKFDSVRKSGDGHNNDRVATEPLSDTIQMTGQLNPAAPPVTRWDGASAPASLHVNHSSALPESERLTARELSVTLSVYNGTVKDITLIRIVLTQHRTVSSGGVTEASHQIVASRDVIPSPPLHPGERRTFDQRLTFPAAMRTHEDGEKKTLMCPVPSMITNNMSSDDTELTVLFPKVKNLAGIANVPNVCQFASDVSVNPEFPNVPARYRESFVFAEIAESGV